MADSNRRGRKNVEKRLIDSASYLVGSVGPNQLTIRDIADHAGVCLLYTSPSPRDS